MRSSLGASPSAGVSSLLQAWEAVSRGETLESFAERAPELKGALAFFGAREKK